MFSLQEFAVAISVDASQGNHTIASKFAPTRMRTLSARQRRPRNVLTAVETITAALVPKDAQKAALGWQLKQAANSQRRKL